MGGINGQFRYKEKIPLPYDVQGYIFFKCKLYRKLSPKEQHKIRECCKEAAGQYYEACFKFLTTNQGAEQICRKYYLGHSTLERCVQKFYMIAETII